MSGLIEEENRKKLKEHVRELEHTVEALEANLKESNRTDNQVMMSLQHDKIKYRGISNQLEEALKENQHLLNIIHEKSTEQDVSRSNSQGDITRSCSTMSIVHLQYKYEELLANHHGLLKLLDLKSEEIKKVHDENTQLKMEIEQLKQNLTENNEKYLKLQTKFLKLKERKEEKINKLKIHKETLQMAHNQLVNVLHAQCMEKDDYFLDEMRNCGDSDRTLLLQEIRRNNMLSYENFQLSQQVEFLKSVVQKENRKKTFKT